MSTRFIVETDDIADSNVTTAKIANGNVTSAKLGTSTAESNWVRDRSLDYLSFTPGEHPPVGAYYFLHQRSFVTGALATGTIIAGSVLDYSGVESQESDPFNTIRSLGTLATGTWRYMGRSARTGSYRRGGIFLRIA